MDNSTVLRLQIVKAPDSTLSGQIVGVSLAEDGTVEQHSAPITGLVDGNHLTITVKHLFTLGDFTLAGTSASNELTLSGAEGIDSIWKRADDSTYRLELNKLHRASEHAVSAKQASLMRDQEQRTEVELDAQTEDTLNRMSTFDNEANLRLAEFAMHASRYRGLTERMTADIAHERLTSSPEMSVSRNRYYVDAEQVSVAADQLQQGLQELQTSFDEKVKPTAVKSAIQDQSCQRIMSQNSSSRLQSVCGRLTKAIPIFRQKYLATESGLRQLAVVYAEEARKERDLLREAEGLSN